MSSLRVVVLTSTRLGVEVAAGLRGVAEIGSLTLMTAPVTPRPKSPLRKAREAYRFDGVPGLLRAAADRFSRPRRATADTLATAALERCAGVPQVRVTDFHAPSAIERLRRMMPDLGVVAGTYRLAPSVFLVPRLGCVNLHLGRAPEFRGSSPGFYEMLEGVSEVGITIHRVSEALDAGEVHARGRVPLDLAPSGDPVEYLRRHQWDVLLPAGVALMAEVVAAIARGNAVGEPQDHGRARTRRRATHALKRELRRRVAGRRAAGG
jgi:methionyl-tRNA formyltransferase